MLVTGLAVVLALPGCPSARRRDAGEPQASGPPGIPASERAFVVDPLQGYPLVTPQGAALEVRSAYRELATTGDTGTARARAEELLEREPSLHPAVVLAAQADLLAADPAGALERLRPVTAELPGYTAAQLLLGRAAERVGEIPVAYRAYRAIAQADGRAAERADALRPRAVEIVTNRIGDALARGRTDLAAEELEELEAWAPEEEETLEAALSVAAARGDRRLELEALKRLRRLVADRRDRTDLVLRQAELELAVGDPTEGLRMVRDLASDHPADRTIQEALERAKFRWRLTLLPEEVQKLARSPELTRAEVAVLVHWLIPQVRSTRRGGGRIAADILDHPFRNEIARVVNLDLMEVDSTLHTFSPERPARRGDVLEALLRAVEAFGPGTACLESAPLGRRPTAEAICGAAARCRILPERADCLPGATLSGAEALDLVRRAVELLSPGALNPSNPGDAP